MNVKNEEIANLGVKLALAAKVLGVRTQSDWLEYFSYADTPNVSRVLNERIGINPSDLKRISEALTIKVGNSVVPSTFHLSPREFAAALNLPDATSHTIISRNLKPSTNRTLTIRDEDRHILESLKGSYKGIYLCREILDQDAMFITIESYEIFDFDAKLGHCPIQQISNFAAGDDPLGFVNSHKQRVSISLNYQRTYFPPSQMLLRVAYSGKDRMALVGLYTDISDTVAKPIFCVPIILFKHHKPLLNRKIEPSNPIFEMCRRVLSPNEDILDRGRMRIRSDADFDDEVVKITTLLEKHI